MNTVYREIYRVDIIPVRDQTNAHFRCVLKPRTKTFKNENNALEYFRLCRIWAQRGQFEVELNKFLQGAKR